MRSISTLAKVIPLLLIVTVATFGFAANDWTMLGPEGGDSRSLAFNPKNPDQILLGTSSGLLFVSNDGGASWAKFAHFGEGDDYVLDNIVFDPQNPNTIYVAVWSVNDHYTGDLFRTKDGGKSWQALPGMRGKSIRAVALAQSNSKTVVVGALDGVFRSTDGGDNWKLISPPGHKDIRNIESVAIDPKNSDVIYAGTWHLPWKTEDGGATWKNIKQGVIDDSDVFSIIIDHSNQSNVYVSACSGIYKSENAGDLFRKVQGIPGSARRTRVLQQDPVNAHVVFAGTTEGLWKTVDSGKTFKRVTPPNYIVNDVMVDPRNPNRVLVATDRSGVIVSNDSFTTFRASNRGFSGRQVATVIADRKDGNTLYAGMVNDKDFGGVFVSRDAGASWMQVSDGLAGRDVFSLSQASSGAVLAGTNTGLFVLDPASRVWRAANTVVREKPGKAVKKKVGKKFVSVPGKAVVSTSQLKARVADVHAGERWIAASNAGLYTSNNNGKSWTVAEIPGESNFISLFVNGNEALASTIARVYASHDGGATWTVLKAPGQISRIFHASISDDKTVWLSTREGAFRSSDGGTRWERVYGGIPQKNVLAVIPNGARLLATGVNERGVFESVDGGKNWTRTSDSGLNLRRATVFRGRVLATSAFNGLWLSMEGNSASNQKTPRTVGGGGSSNR
jgi:photosystem II stability/assembly factor-like uncharacterized protein